MALPWSGMTGRWTPEGRSRPIVLARASRASRACSVVPLHEIAEPAEILRIIALYRFILPKTNLKIAGGRVLNLRDLQSWIFYAGATSILSGNYLTTAGRPVKDDIQMIKDLGLEPQKL